MFLTYADLNILHKDLSVKYIMKTIAIVSNVIRI